MPGRRLGRYALRRRIGRGGEAEVWEAELHGPGGFRRPCAVKLLPEGTDDARSRDALVREARLGALVSHPNVVPTLELGEHDGRWFLVMELVRGVTARQLVKPGPLPPSALLDLARQACEGLAYIHGLRDADDALLGLVHRDIKPGNLLVGFDGRVRIVDLGIAGWNGRPGVPAGTPGFMAPEQLQGRSEVPTDVFGLCATLASVALRAQVLGRGDAATSHLADLDPVSQRAALRDALDGYLPGLGPVLQRGLRADPQARWADTRSLADALEGLQAHSGTPVRLAAVVQVPVAPPPPSPRPAPAPVLVGRDAELAALARLGDASRVLVTGPVGSGTTSLVRAAWPDALWLDLDDVRTPEGLERAVSRALGVPGVRGPSVWAALEDRAPERVIADGADGVLAALERVPPAVRLVATATHATGWQGGVRVRVGPLRREAAVALYRARAGDGATEAEVEAIVRGVDRLPLAVELAAARGRSQGHAHVAAHLSQEVDLSAALASTWQALEPGLQTALAALSAFEGAFPLEAASMVLAGVDRSLAPLEVLHQLVQRSLLLVRGHRFRMLRVVRRFARDATPGVRARARQAHARWLAGVSARGLRDWAADSETAGAVGWRDDLEAAWQWVEARGDDELRFLVGYALGTAQWVQGPRDASVTLLERLLPLAGPFRTVATVTLANRYYARGDLDLAADVAVRTPARGPEEAALLRMPLARVRARRGDTDGARAMLAEILADLERVGSARLSFARYQLGEVALIEGRYEEALEHFRQVVVETETVAPGRLSRMRYQVVVTLLLMESLQAGREELVRCIEAFTAERRDRNAAAALVNLAEVQRSLGDPEAEATAERARQRAEGVDPWVEGAALAQQGWLRLDADDLDGAEALATVVQPRAARKGDPVLAMEAALIGGHVARRRGATPDLAAMEAGLVRVPVALQVEAAWLAVRSGDGQRADRWLAAREGTAYQGPLTALGRSIVEGWRAMEAGAKGRARACVLDADAHHHALGLGPRAPWRRRLEALRARVRA